MSTLLIQIGWVSIQNAPPDDGPTRAIYYGNYHTKAWSIPNHGNAHARRPAGCALNPSWVSASWPDESSCEVLRPALFDGRQCDMMSQ